MPEFDETTKRLRKLLLDHMIESGRAPNVGRIMMELNLPKADVMESLRRLRRGACIVMEPMTENIRMVHPFANITTPYGIEIEGERKWYAEWALESLAVASLFPGKEVTIHSYCPHCTEPIVVKTKDREILSKEPDTVLLHFGVPFCRWVENMVHAWNHMAFFSSEEHIKEWEQEHPELTGATIGTDQGLGMILTVGSTRADYNYGPLTPEDIHQAFERYGFVGDFWTPRE